MTAHPGQRKLRQTCSVLLEECEAEYPCPKARTMLKIARRKAIIEMLKDSSLAICGTHYKRPLVTSVVL